MSFTPAFSRVSDVMTVIAIGTSWTLVLRFVAVTTTSSRAAGPDWALARLGAISVPETTTLASITERDRAVLGKEQLLLIIGLPNMVDIILQFSLRVYGNATWRRMFGLLNY
jgi:hypothetical protein